MTTLSTEETSGFNAFWGLALLDFFSTFFLKHEMLGSFFEEISLCIMIFRKR